MALRISSTLACCSSSITFLPSSLSPTPSPPPHFFHQSKYRSLHASADFVRCLSHTSSSLRRTSGGAGVLERPGFDQSRLYQEPQVEEGGEMGKVTQKRIFGGGDRYRVLLLDHEKHTETRVTSVLPKVVPSVTAEEARECFHISKEKGVGIVTVTVKEHAEFYAQMMARCGLRSGIEPDTDTV